MTILLTGVAGFIGFHVAQRLLARGERVVGLDNLNSYYDVGLKQARLAGLAGQDGFEFVAADLKDRNVIAELFTTHRPVRVVHLAAQAGVRHGIDHPHTYVDSNLVGFLNILEGCRHSQVEHLVYASSSSVYGANSRLPYSVHDAVDHPLSLYAATKKSNELLAHCYAHLFGLPVTGLRFFTVYGPWGRQDMSPFIFTRKILAGEPIDVYNFGRHRRDFTYIDDVVDGVVAILDRPAAADPHWRSDKPDPASSAAPYRLYNIGNRQPVELLRFIACLEQAIGRKAELNLVPMQPGDVEDTAAAIDDLVAAIGFAPDTPIEDGVRRFVAWYRDYYDA